MEDRSLDSLPFDALRQLGGMIAHGLCTPCSLVAGWWEARSAMANGGFGELEEEQSSTAGVAAEATGTAEKLRGEVVHPNSNPNLPGFESRHRARF